MARLCVLASACWSVVVAILVGVLLYLVLVFIKLETIVSLTYNEKIINSLLICQKFLKDNWIVSFSVQLY